MPFTVTDPATGELIAEYSAHGTVELDRRVHEADAAFRDWGSIGYEARAALIRTAADLMEARLDRLSRIVTREMGKPIGQARGETAFAATILRHYAEHGRTYAEENAVPHSTTGPAAVVKAPLGVLLGIMPWNYPHYQVARFVAPNLMLGNTVLVKHAPQCPETALEIERIFRDAGAPPGVLQSVFAETDDIAALIAHPLVRGVSLTGSERAGAAVGALTGHHLKKSVLELGGSDAFLVLDDADVEAAAADAVTARFANVGQACNAAKRFIVHAEVYDRFVGLLVESVLALEPGDPEDESTFIGPMASEAAAAALDAQVQDAVSAGAELHGGGRLVGPGAWYRPGVLTGVTPAMRAWHEELFGPVAVVHRVSNDDEAVTLANDSPYGLGAIVRSADVDRARRLAGRLEVGMVSINGLQPVDPALPFGGVKRSGYGRELGRWAMEEFANRKLIVG